MVLFLYFFFILPLNYLILPLFSFLLPCLIFPRPNWGWLGQIWGFGGKEVDKSLPDTTFFVWLIWFYNLLFKLIFLHASSLNMELILITSLRIIWVEFSHFHLKSILNMKNVNLSKFNLPLKFEEIRVYFWNLITYCVCNSFEKHFEIYYLFKKLK